METKGRHPYAIKRLSQDIGMFGYNRLIVKSDQEASIMELKDRVKRERHEQITLLEEKKSIQISTSTMSEESPVSESKSNGEIERAIQTVQDQIGAVKGSLESRCGQHVPSPGHEAGFMPAGGGDGDEDEHVGIAAG